MVRWSEQAVLQWVQNQINRAALENQMPADLPPESREVDDKHSGT
jgi:hypothetical protein